MAGPAEQDFDEILNRVAEDVTNENHIERLGKALGFRQGPVSNYIKSNFRFGSVTSQGTLQMLRDWNQRTGRTGQGEMLREALIKANLQTVADDHLLTFGLCAPQTLQSTQPQPDPNLFVTENQIMHIARNLLSDFYSPLANALGFQYAEYENIKRKHLLDIKESTLEILHIWKQRSGGEHVVLEGALRQAECGRLAFTYKEA
eukprot:XP_003729809.1 PREDICTED: uncharacterized protein LOC100891655 isoform X3 [Strongylocentrotus purpuratus]